MQENIALAIKNAVEKNQSDIIKDSTKNLKEIKKPDLFSLTNSTELFQNEKGITIKIDREKDSKLTDFGKATLTDRYLSEGESYQDLFARVAAIYASNTGFIKRRNRERIANILFFK